jgi:hypothetical protein
LSDLFDADRRTINRWRAFWQEYFPLTTFWKVARGRLVPAVKVDVLPLAFLEAFVHSGQDRHGWKKLLLFLSPITIPGGLVIAGSI